MTAERVDTLAAISTLFADSIDAAARSVVQVQGRAQPSSGVVVRDDVVLTTGRAIGRENGLHVRTADNRALDAELAGWDPATHLAVLKVKDLGVPPAAQADTRARVGHLVTAIGRSWSNAVTATIGNVAVIGGPLPTGRGQSIDEIIRVTAPMHRGFAGGLLADTAGRALGITTAAEIRGLGVVIPAAIAWKAADQILEHGQVTRGYLGVAGQAVRVGARERQAYGIDTALLVFGVTADSPADRAGVVVGDVIATFDGESIDSPDRLLELLTGDRVGRVVPLKVLRGGVPTELSVTVGQRAG